MLTWHSVDSHHLPMVAVPPSAAIVMGLVIEPVHAHPTLSEVVHEAALDVDGESIHKG